MSDSISLRVSDLIYGIKKRWKTLVILIIVGLVVGIALSGVSWLRGSMSHNYGVTASAIFIPQNENSTYSSKGSTYTIDDYRVAEMMAETVKYVMQSSVTANRIIDSMGLIGVEPSDITNNLSITVHTDTPVLEFKLNWRSAEEGISILNEIMASSSQILIDTLGIGKLSIINEPASQYIVGSVSRIPTWGLTTVLGIIAGLIVIIFETVVNPTLINSNDVQPQFELETIGNVPLNNSYFKKKELFAETSNNPIEQDFATATYILRNRLGMSKGNKLIYLTSTMQGEGKSSYASHLAFNLAEMEQKVLLVDFDFKNPSIGTKFLEEVNYENSFNALYSGEITQDEAILHITGFLDILPSILEHHPVMLDTAVIDLLKSLKEKYDYIIIDAPPVGETADILNLNQVADGALLVIGFDMALKKDIRATIDKLDKSGIRIIGALVNKSTDVSSRDKYVVHPPIKTRSAVNSNVSVNSVKDSQSFSSGDYKNVLAEQKVVATEKNTLSDDEIREELIKYSLQGDKKEEQS